MLLLLFLPTLIRADRAQYDSKAALKGKLPTGQYIIGATGICKWRITRVSGSCQPNTTTDKNCSNAEFDGTFEKVQYSIADIDWASGLDGCDKDLGHGIEPLKAGEVGYAPIYRHRVPCTVYERCPEDCEVNETWSQCAAPGVSFNTDANSEFCSDSDSDGTQTSTIEVVKPASFGGSACPVSATRSCRMYGRCPIDCEVSSWTTGDCSATCGGGQQTKTRTITKAAEYNGTCPALSETVACNQQTCPVNCVGSWKNWSGCSTTCGEGLQSRSYTVDTPAAHGGLVCKDGNTEMTNNAGELLTDVAFETQSCQDKYCPVDCVGHYQIWSVCTADCGIGTQTANFVAEVDAAHGGKACPLTKTRKCHGICTENLIIGEYAALGGGRRLLEDLAKAAEEAAGDL